MNEETKQELQIALELLKGCLIKKWFVYGVML